MAKNSGGRPTAYRAAYAHLAHCMALLGARDVEIARALAVSEVTLNAWKQKHPRFLKALNTGKEQADAQVAQSLYHRALGYSHKAVKILQHEGKPLVVDFIEHYPPDTTACIFWLKNRQPEKWRDVQRMEQTVTHKQTKLEDMNHDQLQAWLMQEGILKPVTIKRKDTHGRMAEGRDTSPRTASQGPGDS